VNIEKDCVVTANFRLFDGNGELVDSSEVGGPLTYLHGAEELLPGLEVALAGHAVGDNLTVELKPDEAFGQWDESLVDKAPRANFPGIEDIEPGMRFQTEMDDGITSWPASTCVLSLKSLTSARRPTKKSRTATCMDRMATKGIKPACRAPGSGSAPGFSQPWEKRCSRYRMISLDSYIQRVSPFSWMARQGTWY